MRTTKFKFIKFTLPLLASSLLNLVALNASATTLDGSLNSRGSFVYPSGSNPGTSSYDGPGKDTMNLFTPLTSSNLLQVNTFDAHAQGSNIQAFLLSEMAAFDGHNGGPANNFGVMDQNGKFTSLLDTSKVDPLAVGAMDQTADQKLTFALQSPEGLFYSVDNKNADSGVAHMLALQVNKNGKVNLPNTNLHGAGPLSFDLLVGDIIFFIEDMKLSGNISTGLVPFASDFDYNDMVVVVRQSANTNLTSVPEPASMVLVSSALVGAVIRRRKLS